MNKKTKIISAVTSLWTLLPCAVGAVLWNKLPETIPVRFDFSGNPTDMQSKGVVVFALPLILLAIHIFLLISSKKQNSKAASAVSMWVCPCISTIAYGMTYGICLIPEFDNAKYIALFVSVAFIVIGNFMPKITLNKTIGYRTRLTLNDSENWFYTHRITGKIWVIGGIVMLICAIFEIYIATFITAVIMALCPYLISYRFHKNKSER